MELNTFNQFRVNDKLMTLTDDDQSNYEKHNYLANYNEINNYFTITHSKITSWALSFIMNEENRPRKIFAPNHVDPVLGSGMLMITKNDLFNTINDFFVLNLFPFLFVEENFTKDGFSLKKEAFNLLVSMDNDILYEYDHGNNNIFHIFKNNNQIEFLSKEKDIILVLKVNTEETEVMLDDLMNVISDIRSCILYL